jgi:hypothetical protein
MPPFAPDTLSNAEVVDILSYILKANELPAGDAALSVALGDDAAAA